MKNKKNTVLNSKKKYFIHGFSALIGIILFCSIPGIATAAGTEAKAEAPWSVINEFFDTS